MVKRLLGVLLLAFVATVSVAQTVPQWAPWIYTFTRWDGGPVVAAVDFGATQTQSTILAAPCGADGPPTFRLICGTDGAILNQAATPGAPQTGNFNASGKGIMGNFEVPSGGTFQATGLSKLTFSSTDGTIWLGLNTLSRDRVPMLAWGVHWGAVVASLWAALQFWVDFNYFPQGPNPASTFVNRNFFAEFAVCTLPFSGLLLARARRSSHDSRAI